MAHTLRLLLVFLQLVSCTSSTGSGPGDGKGGGDGGGSTQEPDGVAWHPLELSFAGPMSHEDADSPNPFLDLRLVVTFVGPVGQTYVVPGFYDGDGRGGAIGNVWKVRFAADQGGTWTWTASFRSGALVAIDADPDAGVPIAPDGETGELLLRDRDPAAPGFLARGRLEYAGGHYLRFAEGGWFLKGGTNSPENLLGYDGFDDVADQGGIGIVHRFDPHVGDFEPGGPEFESSSSGWDSRGLVGALDYLSAQGVNSVYLLPMNLGGDGQETCPFTGYGETDHDRTHYDISRLTQWAQVLDHTQRKGILVQFVLSETEWDNEHWLDDGEFGVQRRLFFRELVARFGHLLALKWNLGEECDFPVPMLRAFAAWIDALDPYDHPIAVHTHLGDYSDYTTLLGDPLFTATSAYYASDQAGSFVEEWRLASAAAGQPWVLDLDEQTPAIEGLSDTNHDDLRKRVLWDVYLSGGNLEWYMGYHPLPVGGDVDLEDFRTREGMWRYMRFAREFLEALPFQAMEPADELLVDESQAWGGGEVFALPDEVYAVYLPDASLGGTFDLTGATGTFAARWFDPRTGAFVGPAAEVEGGGLRALGAPPADPGEDWAWVLTRPDPVPE